MQLHTTNTVQDGDERLRGKGSEKDSFVSETHLKTTLEWVDWSFLGPDVDGREALRNVGDAQLQISNVWYVYHESAWPFINGLEAKARVFEYVFSYIFNGLWLTTFTAYTMYMEIAGNPLVWHYGPLHGS